MKFTDSKEDLYESMIGHFYKSRNVLGNPIIQIVGYGYNLKKKYFFYIIRSSYIRYYCMDSNHLKKKLKSSEYQIKYFDILDDGVYSIEECETFDNNYYR